MVGFSAWYYCFAGYCNRVSCRCHGEQAKRVITKKRQFEELAESERKFRNLFEHSPAGMLRITTPHWNVVDANQALLHMFHVSTFDEVKK